MPFDLLVSAVDILLQLFCHFLAVTADNITDTKPRYVMGIGTPDYILEAIENGIDLFDCVLATRTARNGSVFTDDGMLTLSRSFNEFDHGPIQEGCTCRACTEYSLAYMRHMFKCNEMLGGMLATEHNLTYLYNLILRARKAIEEDRFQSFKEDYLVQIIKIIKIYFQEVSFHQIITRIIIKIIFLEE